MTSMRQFYALAFGSVLVFSAAAWAETSQVEHETRLALERIQTLNELVRITLVTENTDCASPELTQASMLSAEANQEFHRAVTLSGDEKLTADERDGRKEEVRKVGTRAASAEMHLAQGYLESKCLDKAHSTYLDVISNFQGDDFADIRKDAAKADAKIQSAHQ